MRDGTLLRRHLHNRGHKRRSQFVRHRRSAPEDHRGRGWTHRDDGALKSLGCQTRTYSDRPGHGDEAGDLIGQDRDVLARHALMQAQGQQVRHVELATMVQSKVCVKWSPK